jgi:predicted nucleic acid-binding protein
MVEPQSTHTPIRDERDRPFLDLVASHPPPQYFVTGDKDFDAPEYSGVPVISAAAFVRVLKRS